ncbi:50S ribosomal protein L29 [Candidatus Woesearchaeota archaeon]|nr:50S ribosomal protein L29 [Candidatus Woesearchaeota archaeon]
MKFKELEQMENVALDKKLEEIELDLMKLRSQSASGTPPKNPKQILLLKRMVARINTIKKTRGVQ